MCKKNSVKVARCPVCGTPVELLDPDNLCEGCGAVLNRNGMIIENPDSQAAEDRSYIESGLDNLWETNPEEQAALDILIKEYMCAREEEIALSELLEDIAISVRKDGFPMYITDGSTEKIWFYAMDYKDIQWDYLEWGDPAAVNCQYMEAEIVWVGKGEEIDLVATEANVIATILGYLPPHLPKPAWRGEDLNEILGTEPPAIRNIDCDPKELYLE